MRVGIVADTHGNMDYLVLATERLLGPLRVDKIFHLGGAYEDVDELFAFKKKLQRGTEEYRDEHFLADVAEFLAGGGASDEDDDLAEYRRKFVRVPEPGCPAYAHPDVPNKQVEMIGSQLVLLTYSLQEINREDLLNTNIIFHGSMGRHKVTQKGPKFFVCPGHLRDKEHEGVPATFGLLELDNRQARVSFHSIDGQVADETVLKITKKGKFNIQG